MSSVDLGDADAGQHRGHHVTASSNGDRTHARKGKRRARRDSGDQSTRDRRATEETEASDDDDRPRSRRKSNRKRNSKRRSIETTTEVDADVEDVVSAADSDRDESGANKRKRKRNPRSVEEAASDEAGDQPSTEMTDEDDPADDGESPDARPGGSAERSPDDDRDVANAETSRSTIDRAVRVVPSRTEPRMAGEHRFIPSGQLEMPFATTHFSMSTGYGCARIDAPNFDENGERMGKARFQLGALSETFEAQVAITPMFALRAGITGKAQSGVDTPAILTVGGELGYSFGGGAIVSFKRDRFAIGLSIDVARTNDYAFDVMTAITQSLAADVITPGTMFTETTSTAFSPGAQIAVGLHPAIGAWAAAQYNYVQLTTKEASDTESVITGGVGLSIDLSRVSPAPLGMTASYRVEHTPDEPLRNQFAGGLAYTGRSNISIGAEADIVSESEPEADISILVISGLIRARYFW